VARGRFRYWPHVLIGGGALLVGLVVALVVVTRGGREAAPSTSTAPATTTAPPPATTALPPTTTAPPATTTAPPPTTTAPPPAPPVTTGPVTSATTAGGALLVNGQPVFPLMVFEQCPEEYESSLAVGINLFLGNCGRGASAQLAALAERAYAVAAVDDPESADAGLVGWFYPDEADIHGYTGETLPARPAGPPERVTLLTLANHFYTGAAPGPAPRSIYPGLVARADVVGFDLYPLQVWCQRHRLADVYEAQRQLVALAKGKPTFQWIETAVMQCPGNPSLVPTAATVRAESWLAVAGGANGLGFFPYYFPPDVALEIRGIADVVRDLRDVLLAPRAAASAASPGSAVKAGARAHGGHLTVIAVNSNDRAVRATIKVPGLAGRTLTVYGQPRAIAPDGDTFVDAFPPLAAWIYTTA
jgi:hypothetical protein